MIKYLGYIEGIEKDFVWCTLHNDEMPLVKFGLDLPINKIDKNHLNVGEVFYLYIPDNPLSDDYKIEWLPEIPPAQENLNKIDENMAKFLKLFDE